MTDFAAESFPVTQPVEKTGNSLMSRISAAVRRKPQPVNTQAMVQQEQALTDPKLKRIRMELARQREYPAKAKATKEARYAAGMNYAHEYRARQDAKKLGK